MGTGLLQLIDTLHRGRIHYFLIFFAFVWMAWYSRIGPAWFYKPYTDPGSRSKFLTTTIIIPVVDEKLEGFLHGVLDSIIANIVARTSVAGRQLDEIIVVINGTEEPDPALVEACRRRKQYVRCFHRRQPSKRGAILTGVKYAKGEIIVLADSDSRWEVPRPDNANHPGTLVELLKPFADPDVGGVTTHQAIFARQRTLMTRFADWMEDVRAWGSMPAMSVFGAVGCLPGRAIAVRKNIFMYRRRRFMHDVNLGIHKEESDDRTVTNWLIKEGFKTVYQRTARVWTDAPLSSRKYWRQQLRWARGSQYNNWRMYPYYVTHRRTWFVLLIYTLDTIIPFWWFGTIVNMVWKIVIEDPVRYTNVSALAQIGLVVAGIMASAFMRNLGHFRRYPEDMKYLPLYVLLLSVILTPIRVIGFFFMARPANWATRAAGFQDVKGWNPYSLLPAFVGTIMFDLFAVAGPLLETSVVLRQLIEQYPFLFVWVLLSPFILGGVIPALLDAYRAHKARRKGPAGKPAYSEEIELVL